MLDGYVLMKRCTYGLQDPCEYRETPDRCKLTGFCVNKSQINEAVYHLSTGSANK